MNFARQVRPFGWAAASKALPLLYGLIFLIVLIPALSKAEHGRFAIVFNLFTLLTLLNKYLVLHPMIRHAAEPSRFNRIIRAGFQLTIIYYVFFSFFLWFFASPIADILRIHITDVRFVPLLLFAILFREFGFCVQQTRYKTFRLFMLEALYFLGAASGFIYLQYNGQLDTARAALHVILYAAALSSLVAILFGTCGAKLWGKFKPDDIKKLFNYGLITLGIGFSAFIINGMDVLLIAAIYTPLEVALYNGAKAVYRIVSAISQSVSLVVMPYASKLTAEKRLPELTVVYEKISAYSTLLLILVMCAGWIFADYLYSMLFHGRYAGSALILRILLLGAIFEAWYNIAGNFLYGAGLARPVAWISIVVMLIWTALSIPSIYLFGLAGVAGSLSISMLIAGILMQRKAMQNFDTNLVGIFNRFMKNLTVVIGRTGRQV